MIDKYKQQLFTVYFIKITMKNKHIHTNKEEEFPVLTLTEEYNRFFFHLEWNLFKSAYFKKGIWDYNINVKTKRVQYIKLSEKGTI